MPLGGMYMTMNELLEGSTPTELLKLVFILFGIGLVFVALTSWALMLFVALRSPPSQRAAWTAGLAYLIDCSIIIFSDLGRAGEWAPLVFLPGALAVFWFWRWDFRRGWIEKPELTPEGMSLENDDWRTGLIRLIGMIAAATAMALARRFSHGL